MGEYANHHGRRIKIGTCEAMYYLRADQIDKVSAEHGNVDPVENRDALLFRFPWPNEDDIAPGEFDSAWGRGLSLFGVSVPEGVDHGTVQLTHSNGYLLNMPCPEAHGFEAPDDWKLFRNGYGGAVRLVAQRYWEGSLVGVCECKGCGRLYRMPTLGDAAPVLEAIDAMAEREIETADRNGTEGNRVIGERYQEIYRRLASGYQTAVTV